MKIVDVKLGIQSGDRIYKYPVWLEFSKGRIWFLKAAFALKDEIKALKGSHWHGRDDDARQIWSALDCERNRFQLSAMQGKNPYAWWDRPVEALEFERPLRAHQVTMVEHLMTYHYGIIAAEMGLGKTLAAIEIIERSKQDDWWWVGPRSAIVAVEEEFEKWELGTKLTLMTYQGLVKVMKEWKSGAPAPRGVVFDEMQRMKGPTSQRTLAGQALADAIREEYGYDGYVVGLTGTPSPKSPLDWWAIVEICWPGFLREGSRNQLKYRLGVHQTKPKRDGFYYDMTAWLDDDRKCAKCGGFPKGAALEEGAFICSCGKYTQSINEVALLETRLQGIALPFLKKDHLNLPEKQYREIVLKPSKTIQRVAEQLAEIAPTPIQALTWLRELSDGFQYTEKQIGTEPCECTNGQTTPPDCDCDCDLCNGSGVIPIMERHTKMIKCPKDEAIKDLLDENSDQGRLIIFAGFQGSIDRVRQICLDQKWDVVQVDGRGWKVFSETPTDLKPIKYWRSDAARVVYLAHPESGGTGLTLTEARMAVYYSNDFKPENRLQSEDRGHRPGMDLNKGFTIVDLYHLETDRHVRNVLKANRRLELMTLGEVQDAL